MFSSKISPLLHSENVPNLKTPTHFVDPSQFIDDDVSTGANGPGKKKAEKTQTVLEIRLSEKMPLTEGFTVPGQIRLDIVAQT